MGKTTTFIGRVRSYGGARKSGGAVPGSMVQSVIFSFDGATITPVACRVGVSPTAGPLFVLPKGACILQMYTLKPVTGGTTPTVNIGMSGDDDEFFLNYDADLAGNSSVVTGADHIAARIVAGLAANTQVYGTAGTGTAGTGTFTAVMTYTMFDDGLADSEV